LSAKNILLTSGMVAKIADPSVACIVLPSEFLAITPGDVYTPQDIVPDEGIEDQRKFKYDTSIDVFSFGVLAIFTLAQIYPGMLLPSNYRSKDGQFHARTELQRRERYMNIISGQLREKHPLLQMIEACLDFCDKRPTITEMLRLVEQARSEVKDEGMDMNKLDMLRVLLRLSGPQDSAQLLSLSREESQKMKDQFKQKMEESLKTEREKWQKETEAKVQALKQQRKRVSNLPV
jgi:hypothetical protein